LTEDEKRDKHPTRAIQPIAALRLIFSMARTLRAEPSALPIAIRFLSRRYRARPSSGCSGQPSPRARSRVRQPLIRSAVGRK